MNKKPTLAELGLDAPISPPKAKKSWEEIANEVDDQPTKHWPAKHKKQRPEWNGIAAVMSFLIPGLGQLYKGHVLSGLIIFVATLISYGLFILLGIVPHIIAIIDAGNREK